MTKIPEGIERSLSAGDTLVVPSRQRANALRLAHARAALARGERCWPTPRVLSWTSWLERTGAPAGESPRLLSIADEWLLWRRTLDELAEESAAPFRDPIVDALRRAAQLAAEWRISPEHIRGAPGSEAALLARASGQFERHCRDLRVLGRPALLDRIARAPVRPAGVELVGFAVPTAGQRSCPAARFELAERLGRERVAARAQVVAAADAGEEIARAAAWCRARLERDPAQRLLIVVPDLAGRRDEVLRCFRQTLAPESGARLPQQSLPGLLALEGGERLASHPLVACALETLGLALHAAEFERVSVWLRAAHHGEIAAPERAQLDLWLRTRGRTELDLRALAAELAHAPEALRAAAARFAGGCERLLDALEGGRSGPATWAERFRAALAAARWPGLRPLSSDEQQTRERFERLLQELAAVTAFGRTLGLGEAVGLLRDLAARVSFQPASGDPAVTVTDDLCDPVVRYHGIWLTGLHAGAWPLSPSPDPFLPIAAQRAAGIPAASAGGQIGLARRLIACYRFAADELVASWPQRLEEGHASPSSLLQDLPEAGSLEAPPLPATLATRLRAGSIRESFCDESGAPWEPSEPLPAGTRTLELQSHCGFRAYAELRLGGNPLPEPRRGIDPRVRGQLLHRALEKLWRELRDQDRLIAEQGAALAARIERCVHEAALELLAAQSAAGEIRLTRREQRRAARLIAELCELERRRAPFRVAAIERGMAIGIGRARLDVRIDRIDEVPGLGRVVIDYKTGRMGPREWHGGRPSHPQLLAYREAVGDDARVLAMACIGRHEVAFRGIGQESAGMRGIETPAAEGDDAVARWSEMGTRWSAALAALADAFLAGEARVDPASGACDHCHLHGLCRIRGPGPDEPDPDDE